MDERIRLSSTDSANSVDKIQNMNIGLEQHTKLFPFPSVSDTIDQMEVFNQERKDSDKYRLILTINPFCTNVLFNPVTEIVKNEGSEEVEIVNQNSSAEDKDAWGKKNGLTSTDMIRNTEYSNHGFEYHCGYDIFNNHKLRNQTFKVVNKNPRSNDENYNTIMDTMRYYDGQKVKGGKRINLDETPSMVELKLYTREDILSFENGDAINSNLIETNGWYGFNNRNTIEGSKSQDQEKKEDTISKVINGKKEDGNEHEPCEFIEMYPDSSLYSFNPKYNKFKHREEQNWDICITYPYECDYNKELVRNVSAEGAVGDCNGLLLLSVSEAVGTYGQEIIMFRSYVKHNLRKGDTIKLFYTDDSGVTFTQITDGTFKVTNVGDLNNKNKEYYFYINDNGEFDEEGINIKSCSFRFVRVSGGIDCKYYFRKFRKLPNFKKKTEELTDEIAKDKERFNEYIATNGCELENKMFLFNREQYPLAFARTIYGDSTTQVTFTDSIDVKHIVDNLGRPVSELFVTIIKRNKGHNDWPSKLSDKDYEFSHCFTRVDCGISIYGNATDTKTNSRLTKREIMHDVTQITTKNNRSLNSDEITIEGTDVFFGDVVELDVSTARENVLSDVCFRFNTEIRENISEDYKNVIYDEIINGVYDGGDFYVQQKSYPCEEHLEGYYHKAHYSIPIKQLGDLRQSQHNELYVNTIRPFVGKGLYLEITTRIPHNLAVGDTVILCDDEGSVKWKTNVHSVVSNTRCLICRIEGLSIDEIIDGVNNGLLKFRSINSEIPSYAFEIEPNLYVWRDVLTVGAEGTTTLPEYPFANGHFYINKTINFFLKRQDPFGYNGLYYGINDEDFPNDVSGNVLKTSEHEYNNEEEIVC